MIQCGPIGAWLHSCCNRSIARCGVHLLRGGASLRRAVILPERVHVGSSQGWGGGSVGVLGRECGRARLSAFWYRNLVVFNADSGIGSTQRKGIAIKVTECVLKPSGVDNEESGPKHDTKTSLDSVVLSLHEEVEDGFHRLDSASYVEAGAEAEAEAEDMDEEFLSGELILNSQAALSNTRPVDLQSKSLETEEPLTVWPQMPGEPERWWRIPDFIYELLPVPKTFDLQLEILYDKLGCRIHSRELLLRILVHKSFYLSKMPQSVKERKLRKPLMSWQRSQTLGDDNLMTFADAHGEARLQLALLGDAVLNLAASHYLIRQHPLLSTGRITERRSQMVCNSNLARAWSTLLGLRELVLCDPPLSQSKKASTTTVLELQMKACADTMEAYIGGLYVEKGLESALQCVETRLLPLLLLAEPTRNPVALLHEQCVVLLQEKPDYKLIGIDNKNTPNELCRIRVYVKGFRMSTGVAKSQKLARRDAAEKALLKWSEIFG